MNFDRVLEVAETYLLPRRAAWAVSLSIVLATLLPPGLLWLQVDTLLSSAVSTRLAILLPSAVVLVIGAYIALFLVVRHDNKILVELNDEYKKNAPRIKNIRESQRNKNP